MDTIRPNMAGSDTRIEVLAPGSSTTIQDTGRPGHMCQGIPPSGAQDFYALSLANRLVGNSVGQPPLTPGDPGSAALEATLRGPRLRFSDDVLVAVTGAGCPVTIDGEPAPTWQALRVDAGAVLKVGTAKQGLRCYIAVSGGIEAERWLDSGSTYVRGGQGGMEGRILRKGDVLRLADSSAVNWDLTGARIPDSAIPQPGTPHEIRVVPGPQADLFTDRGVEDFFTQDWKLSAVSDRMGFRIDGVELEVKDRADYLAREAGTLPTNVVLDVTAIGAIQITSGTEAIIMGVEAPSIGGYAKIATVISADYGRLGQVRPGEGIHFRKVTLDEALNAAAEQMSAIQSTGFEGLE